MKKTLSFLLLLFWWQIGWCQQISDIRSLLSSRGKALFGDEPNSIVVIDYPENLQNISDYLDTVDVAPRQVVIEARVVEVTLAGEHSLGVNWSLFGGTTDGPGLDLRRHLNFPTTLKIQGAAGSAISQSIPYKSTYMPPHQQDTGEETPFTLTVFNDNISVVLNTLANELKTNILSAPRITTVNNRSASIDVSRRLPWAQPTVTTSDTGMSVTYEVKFEDVGIKLKATPTISEDGQISMVLEPDISEKFDDFPLEVVEGSGVGAVTIPYLVPIIDRRTANTKVVVSSGQTLIIGGLIKDWRQKEETKVPLLGDLPVLGRLFKTTKNIKDKTQLLIFVSPTLVDQKLITRMGKEKTYGLGKELSDDIKRDEQMAVSMETQEIEKKDNLRKTVDQLSKQQAALSAERMQLQDLLTKEENEVKVLRQKKGAKKTDE